MSQSFFLEVLCLNFSPGQKIKHLRSMAVTSILQNSALRIENLVLPYQLLRCRPLFRLMQVAPPSDWFSNCACFMNVPHLCVITHRNVVTCSTRDVLNCAKQSFVPVWVCQSFFFQKKKKFSNSVLSFIFQNIKSVSLRDTLRHCKKISILVADIGEKNVTQSSYSWNHHKCFVIFIAMKWISISFKDWKA